MMVGGRVAVEASCEEMFSRLSDPRKLEDRVPAVEWVEVLDEDSFTVSMAPSTGLGITPLKLRVNVSDRRDNEGVRLSGEADGGEFTAAFQLRLEFVPDGQASQVRWSAEARFVGLLSSIGQRVLPAIVAAQVEAVVRQAASPT
ncbi:MAG: SRPBCC domain-containing protein [Actinomycetota bacterium]|nr:SRPBCC domain-containing protein [Actinomycetota bacterium]